MELFSAHRDVEPPKLRDIRPEVPVALEELVDRMLRKNPADRPQTPREVIDALEMFSSESILKTFAADLRAMSNSSGHLPKEPTPGYRTGTVDWIPPAVSVVDDLVPSLSLPLLPAASPNIAVARPRAWLIAASAVGLTLLALYLSVNRGPETVDLLKHFDAARNVVSGEWQRDGEELLSSSSGNAYIQLAAANSADFRLEITAKLIEGGPRWAIVHSGEPNFAIVFALTLQLADEEVPTERRDDPTQRTWSGDWGDFADSSPRRFVVLVQNDRLTLERDGIRILETVIPSDGELSHATFPASVLRSRGIYLLTTESQFRFSHLNLTPLSNSKR